MSAFLNNLPGTIASNAGDEAKKNFQKGDKKKGWGDILVAAGAFAVEILRQIRR